MPLYRSTSYKRMIATGEVWSNVYTMNALDVFDAETSFQTLIQAERQVHYDLVKFFAWRVVNIHSKVDQRSGEGNANGLLHHDTLGEQLPMFCTVRVIFTDQFTRPEQKYLRMPGFSDRITAGASWDADLVNLVQTAYADSLLTIPEYTGPAGEAHVLASVSPFIQNRQISWHRRHRAGLKRGWVPA